MVAILKHCFCGDKKCTIIEVLYNETVQVPVSWYELWERPEDPVPRGVAS